MLTTFYLALKYNTADNQPLEDLHLSNHYLAPLLQVLVNLHSTQNNNHNLS